MSGENADLETAIAQQLKEMMKLGPSSSNLASKQKNDDPDDEIDDHFGGMVYCHFVKNMSDA